MSAVTATSLPRQARPTHHVWVESGGVIGENLPLARGHAVALFLVGFLMNQSSVTGGFNMSLADLVVGPLFVFFLARQKIRVPTSVALFLLLVLAQSAISVAFVCPTIFGVPASWDFLSGTVRLFTSAMYLLIPLALRHSLGYRAILHGFAIGALVAAGLALVTLVFNLQISIPWFNQKDGLGRMAGFMSDPNFFAVLECAAIVCFAMLPGYVLWFRVAGIVLCIGAVLMSGSKTGFVTLAAVAIAAAVTYSLNPLRELSRRGFMALTVGLTAFLVLVAPNTILGWLNRLSGGIPAFARVIAFLRSGSIDAGGSGRGDVWSIGLEVIQRSPFLGVGIGNYGSASSSFAGTSKLAHDSYLQWAAEWGIPLALAFLLVVAWLTLTAYRNRTASDRANADLRVTVCGVMVAVLVGSLSLSLTNARLFWITLGMLIGFRLHNTRSVFDESKTWRDVQRSDTSS